MLETNTSAQIESGAHDPAVQACIPDATTTNRHFISDISATSPRIRLQKLRAGLERHLHLQVAESLPWDGKMSHSPLPEHSQLSGPRNALDSSPGHCQRRNTTY